VFIETEFLYAERQTDGRTDMTETNGLFRQLWETLKRRRLGDKERRHNVRRQFL